MTKDHKRRRSSLLQGMVATAVRRGLKNGSATEKKFQLASANELTATAFATTWATKENATMDCISGTAQGDTEDTRDGRVYHITACYINGLVSLPVAEMAVAPTGDIQYVIKLVLDTQTNGAQLTATDVMDGSGTEDTLAFRNLQHTSRFKILGTRKGIIRPWNLNEGAVNSFAHGESLRAFNFVWVPKTPLKVICSNTGSTITGITDNSLHVIACATSTSAQLEYQVRLRFTG